MKTAAELQKEIGEWSRHNFGKQETQHLRIVHQTYKNENCPVACLDHLAPLMGFVEEYGEYGKAVTQTDTLDALADMGIYLFDYTFRAGIDMQPIVDSIPHKHEWFEITDVLSIPIGKLMHVELKHLQGIRKYAIEEYYKEQQLIATWQLYHSLNKLCTLATNGSTIIQVTEPVWSETVSKRDWKKNVQTGDTGSV